VLIARLHCFTRWILFRHSTQYIFPLPLWATTANFCFFFLTDVYASVTCVFYIAIISCCCCLGCSGNRACYTSSINALLVSWIRLIFLFAVTSYSYRIRLYLYLHLLFVCIFIDMDIFCWYILASSFDSLILGVWWFAYFALNIT